MPTWRESVLLKGLHRRRMLTWRESGRLASNSALKQYGEESRAFAVAHAAAKRTPKKDPTPGD